jgi:hypothetical protein
MSHPSPLPSGALGPGSTTPPSPAGGRRRGGLVVALAVVVSAVVGVSAYVVMATDEGGADAPERAVRDYLTAAANRDCEGVVALLSTQVLEQSGGRQQMIDDCEDSQEDDVEEGDDVTDEELASLLDSVETTDVQGDRATVTYAAEGDITGELDATTMEVALVTEDGAWKVDNFVPVAGDLPAGSPQAAARDHAQALLDRNCEAFLEVLTEEAQAELGDAPEERLVECERLLEQSTPISDARLGPVVRESVDEGVAVVAVTIFSEQYEAGNNVFFVTVIDDDGVWKVDQLGWSGEPG